MIHILNSFWMNSNYPCITMVAMPHVFMLACQIQKSNGCEIIIIDMAPGSSKILQFNV